MSARPLPVTVAAVLLVLNIISAAPGLVFAPSTTLFIFALITVVGFAALLVLAVPPFPGGG